MAVKVTMRSTKPTNYKRVEAKYIANANRFVDKLATFMAKQSKDSMSKTPINPLTGRSRAGNAPAIDSSKLVNSVLPKHVSDGVAKVYTNVVYAKFLETKYDRYFLSPRSVAYINTAKAARAMANTVGKV